MASDAADAAARASRARSFGVLTEKSRAFSRTAVSAIAIAAVVTATAAAAAAALAAPATAVALAAYKLVPRLMARGERRAAGDCDRRQRCVCVGENARYADVRKTGVRIADKNDRSIAAALQTSDGDDWRRAKLAIPDRCMLTEVARARRSRRAACRGDCSRRVAKFAQVER